MSKFLLKNIQMSKQKCPNKNVQNENVQNKNENVQNDWNCTEKSTYDLRVRRWQLIVISMIALPKSIVLPQILRLSSNEKNFKHLRLIRLRSYPTVVTMRKKPGETDGRTDGRTGSNDRTGWVRRKGRKCEKRTWDGWRPIIGMSKEKWIGIWSIATGFVSQCPSISLCHNHWWWFMQCESKILAINFILIGTVTSISEIQTIFQSINLYLRCLSEKIKKLK